MAEATQLLHGIEREEQVTTAQRTFSFASSVLNLPFSADLVSGINSITSRTCVRDSLFCHFLSLLLSLSTQKSQDLNVYVYY